MFSALRLTIPFTLLILTIVSTGFSQSPDFERRMAAMQEARSRANGYSSDAYSGGQTRVASAGYEYGTQTSASRPAPSSGQPAASRTTQASSHARIARAPAQPGRASNLRVAQLNDQPMYSGGSPVASNEVYHGVVEGDYHESGYEASCGDSCGYFDGYGSGDLCCDRGACPPGDCALTGLGLILYRGDYFVGAQGFQEPMYLMPQGTAGDLGLERDNNFGFYGGANFGIPMCKLTCGLFNGQWGVRSVQSNFGGGSRTGDHRDQTFMTAGLFRRVDYGFQGGVVADILWDNWFVDSNFVQLRSDLSYLWAGGTSFGFRYHVNMTDDTSTVSGINLVTYSEDSYRFYLRHEAQTGGFGEIFAGWSDSRQTVFGIDLDVPVTERLAAQAGFTYYGDDTLPQNVSNPGGYQFEGWNVYAGFAFRPMGRCYYRGYDRPFFNVADNGSMMVLRRPE